MDFATVELWYSFYQFISEINYNEGQDHIP